MTEQGPQAHDVSRGTDVREEKEEQAITLRPSGLPVGDLLITGATSLDGPVPARVLAIGAHPDDAEFGCGATLAKWAAAGCDVHVLVLTDGSKGTWDPAADTRSLIAARAAECRRAHTVLCGGSQSDGPAAVDNVTMLGLVDGELEAGQSERESVCRIIRKLRPDAILAHDPWRRYRLHPDHRAAGFLAIDALVAARDPHYFPGQPEVPHRPHALFLWEPDLPNHVEDAAGFELTKVDALLCHASQHQSTMGIGTADGEPSADQRSELMRKIVHQLQSHGSLVGIDAGEAFRLITDL